MSVSVQCPGCEVTCTVPPELLGRTGQCNQCGRRIRLATPLAELLDAPSAAAPTDLPPVDDLGDLEPLDLSPLARPQSVSQPLAAQPLVEPAADPRPRRAALVGPPRGPSMVLLAVLALVGMGGGGAAGALLVKYLVPAPQPRVEQRPASDPPAPAPAPGPPAPNPPEPKPPEPKPPEPKPKPPEPKPPEPKPPEFNAADFAGPKATVKLPGAAVAALAGGGGRFIVFQTAPGDVVVYDNQIGQPFWTVNGAKPEDLVAVSRTKLFLGRVKDSQIARFDLATGAGEGAATLKGATATLKHLTIGSASDGPLLLVTRANEQSYRMRLIDPNTLNETAAPIDDPMVPAIRGFPFGVTTAPAWVAASADGRALMLGNRYLVREEDRYRGGLLPNVGSAQHLPTTDGQSFVGTKLYRSDGTQLPPGDLPAGMTRRYIPAASGPFVVSVEYKLTDPSVVKLWLHLGADPKPLGPLPGGDEVAAWAKGEPGWVSKLHHRLVFTPDPARLIFCPPGVDSVSVYPIKLSPMLDAAGRDIAFTSTPPAEAPLGRAYSYSATVVAVRGPITFALEAGPPGMALTRDGVLNWPRPLDDRPSYEVTIAARDARGAKTVQTFRVYPRKSAEVPNKEPKEERPPPKEDP